MFQLPECKEWQVCTPELSQVFFNFFIYFINEVIKQKLHENRYFSEQILIKGIHFLYLELFVCIILGFHVRLLLLGPLHGKRLHHAGSGLPEIHEQPGQV